VATDADLAGRVAAERDYWLLAPYGLAATHAALPEGSDPASMVEASQADHLVAAIEAARPLAETLIDERLANIEAPTDAVLAAVRVLAAQPADQWTSGAEHIAEHTGVPSNLVRAALLSHVRAWNSDPRLAAQQNAWQVHETKERLAARRAEQRRKENPEAVQADTARPEQKPDTPPAQRGIDR
jgi:DNA primase